MIGRSGRVGKGAPQYRGWIRPASRRPCLAVQKLPSAEDQGVTVNICKCETIIKIYVSDDGRTDAGHQVGRPMFSSTLSLTSTHRSSRALFRCPTRAHWGIFRKGVQNRLTDVLDGCCSGARKPRWAQNAPPALIAYYGTVVGWTPGKR